MSEKKYFLRYDIEAHPKGISKKAAKGDGAGWADALFLASIIYPPDGSLSMLFMSKDGRTGKELDDNEWFKVWALLAARLAQSKTLGPGKRGLCADVHEMMCEMVKERKHVPSSDH